MEDKWAKAKGAGKQVSVHIDASYSGRSQRPTALTVRFMIDGHYEKLIFKNQQQEKPRGKR